MIVTERLELIPLDATLMRAWLYDVGELEKKLHCSYRGESLTGEFGRIVEGQLEVVEKHPENIVWQGFWLIILRRDRIVVGSADFKNLPDGGEVEIGYGLEKPFEHNGYMTETVKAMCDFAFASGIVESVSAETEKWNIASQRVLARCGFKLFRAGDTLWWKLKKTEQAIYKL